MGGVGCSWHRGLVGCMDVPSLGFSVFVALGARECCFLCILYCGRADFVGAWCKG